MIKQITRTELIHKGKANNVYATNDPMYLELEASDRVSAGNGAKTDVITNKGISNNQVSSAIFKYLEEYGIPTHYVSEGSNPASKIVLKADMIPLEVIARNMATGSFCKRYGVSDGSYFTETFIEYTFKSDASGDPPIDRETILALSPESTNIWDKRELYLIEYYVWRICELLTEFYENLGVELIDFKVEFGRLPNGQIILADEISPDTCRLVDYNTGEKLDKDRFREDLGDVSKGYEEILKRVKKNN